MPPGMMQAGVAATGPVLGQNSAPGRGLASYRAAPVTVAMPIRLTARIPFGVFTR